MQRLRVLLVGLENSSSRVSCLWVRGGSFRILSDAGQYRDFFSPWKAEHRRGWMRKEPGRRGGGMLLGEGRVAHRLRGR